MTAYVCVNCFVTFTCKIPIITHLLYLIVKNAGNQSQLYHFFNFISFHSMNRRYEYKFDLFFVNTRVGIQCSSFCVISPIMCVRNISSFNQNFSI